MLLRAASYGQAFCRWFWFRKEDYELIIYSILLCTCRDDVELYCLCNSCHSQNLANYHQVMQTNYGFVSVLPRLILNPNCIFVYLFSASEKIWKVMVLGAWLAKLLPKAIVVEISVWKSCLLMWAIVDFTFSMTNLYFWNGNLHHYFAVIYLIIICSIYELKIAFFFFSNLCYRHWCPVGFGSNFQRDHIQEMCKTLRVLNAVRDPEIGIPLSIEQYKVSNASW
jgi:hypothetical protein